MIIFVFFYDFEVFVFDEVVNGFDLKSVRILKELFFDFKKWGRSIFFLIYVLEVVEVFCDRIGIIYCGEIVVEGILKEFKEFIKEESFEEVFLKFIEGKSEVEGIVKVLREVF